VKEQIPSPPPEELLLPVVDDVAEERLPDEDFLVNDDTREVLQATSDRCLMLNTQATRLAIAYCYLNLFGAAPVEDWDGRDGTEQI
jgi:hypothetical protein